MATATVTTHARLIPEAIHAILSAEASRQSLPQCYQRDLTVHDLNDLVRTGTQEFIWVLRDGGTHLIHLDVPTIDQIEYHPEIHLAGVVQFCDSRQLYYIFRGGVLTPCTTEEACGYAAAAARSHHLSRPHKEA